MGKHIQETDLKTVNGQSLVGTGDLNIEGGGIKPENIGFGLSYKDDKIQLGEESKDDLGNIKHLVKLEDKDIISIGEIVSENKKGTGGISVTKYYGTKVLIESNSSQEDNTSTLEMNGASFRLNAYNKNFNGEIRTGGVYFQNGLFYISNGDGVGTQNQIAPLADFSAYTVGLKVDDKDYKGAIATVPYVKRTVDGLAGNGLNSANGKLNVNPKLTANNDKNFIDLYYNGEGIAMFSDIEERSIDNRITKYSTKIFSDTDGLEISFIESGISGIDGSPYTDNSRVVLSGGGVDISTSGNFTVNGKPIYTEEDVKNNTQFGKSYMKLSLSNNYIAIDNSEPPILTRLGDVLYLNANLTNASGVSKGVPIQPFNIANFRPARTLYFTVPIDDGTAVIKITKLGTLTIESVSNLNSKNIYINVSFLNKEIK